MPTDHQRADPRDAVCSGEHGEAIHVRRERSISDEDWAQLHPRCQQSDCCPHGLRGISLPRMPEMSHWSQVTGTVNMLWLSGPVPPYKLKSQFLPTLKTRPVSQPQCPTHHDSPDMEEERRGFGVVTSSVVVVAAKTLNLLAGWTWMWSRRNCQIQRSLGRDLWSGPKSCFGVSEVVSARRSWRRDLLILHGESGCRCWRPAGDVPRQPLAKTSMTRERAKQF